jgi:hypothetical protein
MDRIMNFRSGNEVRTQVMHRYPYWTKFSVSFSEAIWMLGARHFGRRLLILSVSTCIKIPGWSVVRDPAERT